MRRFVDLHLRQPAEEKRLEAMLRLASELGYSAVAIVSIQGGGTKHGGLGEGTGIDLISRIDLRPKSDRTLTAELAQVRRRFEVVAVECLSKAVARQAAKDHRVDLLDFSPSLSIRAKVWFDREEAGLASGSNCAYEINASDLLGKGPAVTARLLSIVRREVDNARGGDVPIVLSSGAESTHLMREPRGLAALLDLLEVDEEEGLDMISLVPMGIVDGNRGKMSRAFVSPGVRMAEWDAERKR